MDNGFSEIKKISRPDKLGILSATIIIALSFFGSNIDGLVGFLFGTSLLTLSLGFAFNSKIRGEKNTNQDEKKKIVKTYFEERLLYDRFPGISKLLFWISGFLFIGFVIRIMGLLI